MPRIRPCAWSRSAGAATSMCMRSAAARSRRSYVTTISRSSRTARAEARWIASSVRRALGSSAAAVARIRRSTSSRSSRSSTARARRCSAAPRPAPASARGSSVNARALDTRWGHARSRSINAMDSGSETRASPRPRNPGRRAASALVTEPGERAARAPRRPPAQGSPEIEQIAPRGRGSTRLDESLEHRGSSLGGHEHGNPGAALPDIERVAGLDAPQVDTEVLPQLADADLALSVSHVAHGSTSAVGRAPAPEPRAIRSTPCRRATSGRCRRRRR